MSSTSSISMTTPDSHSPLGFAGRYAPSPSGDLHLGNLRTAILAWVFARRTGRDFLMRMEDLNRVQEGSAERQLEDMEALGLDWDGPVAWQSKRLDLYQRVVAALDERGLVYECYCTRREIHEAPSAPHAPPGAYPGTCRELTEAERKTGREKMRALNREPSLRLRADTHSYEVTDLYAGHTLGDVDDFVLVRGDGMFAYNLVAVVDDIETGVDQVVRGDDLLSSSPRQAYLTDLLAQAAPWLFPHPERLEEDPTAPATTSPHRPSRHLSYIHVPLALNTEGARLAKRDGAVTLRDRLDKGESPEDVAETIGNSLGLPGCRSARDILEAFDPDALPRAPWIYTPGE
ncbi:tRNA glutamyl-Q(34) synthetase GluQRS [Dermabacter hominis]|nr:tRNA glutamyl-Q(34) synthetase GluQRS [Dermabacter hominis]MCT2056212.1 tRNA glutamyl-Q(34) synthetase GluQRS [Dermabacter hominis]MCT2083951.1 tRNA glutamyl-Q(34) synthetase GluQRS [Dermabacter hominis]MCT2091704.1 tRNA glutamyl-Q(34) synthetase GluQRS [Dermabacter hominis]MCT2190747.1 tRNA glutamyl-Q(34) synthetase GluQRS [Dermabacter hominis]MCT2227279.1 tRNA glutamyl-Q(34) synthetase GluQRS [Dermabacter hominis]